ncbi:MAG: FAD-binding oxidoreductase [Oscillatoriales cyanobacterium]|nr:MAG: FAD-binding oxidoreductase [Oscillatoriales cyanobacterium]TAH19064.1 MAG: FAD-binding oxidoreductase [Oscillatoriales cyanobacterium]
MKSIAATNLTQIQELESIVHAAGVSCWQDAGDFWQERLKSAIDPDTDIDCIVFPDTQEKLAAVVACASRNSAGILTCGNGSKLNWGGLVKLNPANIEVFSEPPLIRGAGGIVAVSTSRLNRLVEHAVGDLTVTAEAGMKFADLQQVLATAGQFLPIDPAYPQHATLGGIIATADTGSLRHRYRGVRDLLLGMTFVRSDGKIATAGGRVVKNVAGYDLMKLFTGAYGTLGIISQVTFRVYPLPESSGTVILTGEAAALTQATQILLSSALTPTAVDLLSPNLVAKLGLGKGTGLIVRFQSIAESIEQQSARLRSVGEKLGLQANICRENDENQLWQTLPETIWNSPQNSTIICKIGIRPSESVKLIHEFPIQDAVIHAGCGLGILRFDQTVTPEVIKQIRKTCEAKGGFLTILVAPAALKQQLDVWGYTGSAIDVMRGIKQQFDSQNILSPNRFLSGV